MTLEDVIKIGKNERKISDIVEAFRKNPYTNAIMGLGKVDGMDKLYQENAIDKDKTDAFSAVQQNEFAEFAHGVYAGGLIAKVQEDCPGVVGAIASKKDGQDRTLRLVSKFEPVKYNGINEGIYSAHEKIIKMRDPNEAIKRINEKYSGSLAGRAVLFLLQKHEGLLKGALKTHYKAAEKELKDKLENADSATGYLGGIYQNSDDKTKAALAYEFGRAISQDDYCKEELEEAA